MSFEFVNVFGTHGTTSSIRYLSRFDQHVNRSSPIGMAEHSFNWSPTSGTVVPAGYPHSAS